MFGVFSHFGCMHRKSTLELLPFDLRNLKKSKDEQVRIKDIQNDRYSDGNNDHNGSTWN